MQVTPSKRLSALFVPENRKIELCAGA